MFSSLLRRPSHGSRRVDLREPSLSPSSRPGARRRYGGRTHATADFTEADDDDEDSNEERVLRFEEGGDDDAQDEDGDGDGDGDGDDADEDGRTGKALPVLPLFSATHLGTVFIP